MNKILILANTESDLSKLLLANCPGARMHAMDDENTPFDDFDSVCILGGTEEAPITFHAPVRMKIDKMIAAGKPVFCEFASSIGCVYSGSSIETTHHRLVYSDAYHTFGSLKRGDILDGHNNGVISYVFVPADARPILTYHDYLCAHDHIDMDDETFLSGKWALWKLQANMLIAAFRICNFNRARLAPRDSWLKVLAGIVDFLAGEPIDLSFPKPVCTLNHGRRASCTVDMEQTVKAGLQWYRNAGMLCKNGTRGVLEGFFHHIDARNGKQKLLPTIRTDCAGETGGAFLLDYLLTGNAQSYEIFRNTEAFCFDYMQIKEGPHKGMVRWSESAWEVCYQDDVARAILPTLICQNFGPGSDYFCEAQEALRYMVETTGEDGLRPSCTECCNLTEKRRAELKLAGTGKPSAHFNAYYHAALLLAARAGAPRQFAEVAVKGLTTLMQLYPNTRRETSETEEMCRLVLPLALLYEYTGDQIHYGWLRRVVEDLQSVQHPSGGYAEWDTDYQAFCSRNHTGECALLANNGDPVADLLYSNNWLPMGFAYAYLATGETYFYERWEATATFLLNCQLSSDDPLLHGAWTRAVDMGRMEVYGVPHDVGWAPCCIETGWTVAEILMGLQFMTLVKKRCKAK